MAKKVRNSSLSKSLSFLNIKFPKIGKKTMDLHLPK